MTSFSLVADSIPHLAAKRNRENVVFIVYEIGESLAVDVGYLA